jgi:RNA polymerase sigma factor (sigma-70 family)
MHPLADEYDESRDQALVAEARVGSAQAMEALARAHQRFIYNIALRMVRDPHDAADLTQEILLKMLANLSKFESKSSFRTWLYRMAVNHFISATRKKSEVEVHSFGELGEFLDKVYAEEEMSAEEQLARRAEIRAIRDLCMTGTLLCLDRQQRIVFILGSIFNVSSTVAAEILDISPANFRKQLSRAKADLFQFMEDKCGLMNPNNPCRCYKKTKGFIREGKVDALVQRFIPKVTETIDSVVGRKNEELDALMEGKYLSLFRSQPYHEENIADNLVKKLLVDEDVRKLFQLK